MVNCRGEATAATLKAVCRKAAGTLFVCSPDAYSCPKVRLDLKPCGWVVVKRMPVVSLGWMSLMVTTLAGTEE